MFGSKERKRRAAVAERRQELTFPSYDKAVQEIMKLPVMSMRYVEEETIWRSERGFYVALKTDSYVDRVSAWRRIEWLLQLLKPHRFEKILVTGQLDARSLPQQLSPGWRQYTSSPRIKVESPELRSFRELELWFKRGGRQFYR